MRIIRWLPERPNAYVIELGFAPHCFILLSYRERELADLPDEQLVEPITSFLYRNPNGYATEWEPQYGPIQIYTRAKPDETNARPHYAWPSIAPKGSDWSQLAVQREGLKVLLMAGNIAGIFAILKRWSER